MNYLDETTPEQRVLSRSIVKETRDKAYNPVKGWLLALAFGLIGWLIAIAALIALMK